MKKATYRLSEENLQLIHQIMEEIKRFDRSLWTMRGFSHNHKRL